MSVYALNNYSENLSGHKLEIISGSDSINCSCIVRESGEGYKLKKNSKMNICELKLLPGKNPVNCLSIVFESGENYKFTSGHKKDICELKLLQGNNPANYFIAREFNESYGSTKFPDRELDAGSSSQLSGLSDNALSVGSTSQLSELTDSALVARLERLRGKERKIQLDILLYIIELEKRKLYLPRGYNSLFEFCTRHLGYSRASAYRRIQAARCVERFPKVADMLLTGELNISVVSLISGILTKENINDILSLVVGKSYRDAEIAIVMYKPMETKIRDKVKPVCVLEKKSASDVGTDPGNKSKGTTPDAGTNPGAQNSEKSLNVETKADTQSTAIRLRHYDFSRKEADLRTIKG